MAEQLTHRKTLTKFCKDTDQILCARVEFYNDAADDTEIILLNKGYTKEQLDKFLEDIDNTKTCVSQCIYSFTESKVDDDPITAIWFRNGNYLSNIYDPISTDHYWVYFRNITIPPILEKPIEEKIPKKRGRKPGTKIQKAPKRNPNGFQLFCKDNRESVKNEMRGSVDHHEITRILGQRWKNLDEEEKKLYLERSKRI